VRLPTAAPVCWTRCKKELLHGGPYAPVGGQIPLPTHSGRLLVQCAVIRARRSHGKGSGSRRSYIKSSRSTEEAGAGQSSAARAVGVRMRKTRERSVEQVDDHRVPDAIEHSVRGPVTQRGVGLAVAGTRGVLSARWRTEFAVVCARPCGCACTEATPGRLGERCRARRAEKGGC
jgi:hypothetical protein